ncbi:MAG: H-X9-DG-CTERM domain-containing protein [Planctomycetota bacterium]
MGRSDAGSNCLFADGHVETRLPSSLIDMRLWIDNADSRRFKFDPY